MKNRIKVLETLRTTAAVSTNAQLLRMIAEITGGGTSVRGILYDGPSMINGEPIIVIATCNSDNPKTGDLVQIWIVLRDMHPQEGLTTGADKAICGSCAHRPRITTRTLKSGPNKGEEKITLNRSCYVNIMGPTSVWNTYHKSGYKNISPIQFVGARVRWGAYGDPAAMPVEIFDAVNAVASDWVGYTHQYLTKQGKKFRGSLMASVDTPQQESKARAAGWSTFRVGLKDGSDQGESTECPATVSKGKVKCTDCMACDGSQGNTIYVAAHGQTANLVPMERLAARKSKKTRRAA